MKTLNWWNLKNNKCPKCGKDLRASTQAAVTVCMAADCDFKIANQRMQEIVANLVTQDLDRTAAADGWERFHQ